MKKTNYGTIVLMVIGLVICVGCSQVSFNNPFGESEPTRTNVNTADNTADNAGSQASSTTTTIKYVIRFDSNGGSGSMADLTADGGQTIVLTTCTIVPPVGKKFNCWNGKSDGSDGASYADGASVKNLADTDGEIVRLYAQWIDETAYRIIYLNAKNANNPNKTSFLETDTIVLQDVSADGFTFDGWYEVTDNIADTSTDGWNAGSKTADVTLWAKWTAINNDPTDPIDSAAPTAKVYTIKFDNNTGSGSMADITADVGTTITLPTCTLNAPTGKKFSCWNGKADGSDGISYADSASVKNLSETDGEVVTLYAQWIDKDAHRIVYHNTKNADNSSNPTSSKESETVMLTNVSISGWTFGGWYDSSADGTIVSGWSAGERTDDVSLWAKWTPNEVTYTVKRYFQNVSGSGYDASVDIVKSGLTDAMTDVTADTVTGFTAQHIAQQIITGDGSTVVSVYYDRNVVVYTLNANGGSWDDDSNVKKAVGLYGAEVETPVNPARAGYTYAGWDKTLPTVFGETAETWTAQWTENSYTIVFDANGGTGTMSNQNMTYDVKTNLFSNKFTRNGYMFLGWATSASSINATYTDIESVLNLTDKDGMSVSLYAKWLERPSEIAVGDIMYSDMTFSQEYVEGKTPIGIVFEVGAKVKILHLKEKICSWCLPKAEGYEKPFAQGADCWRNLCTAVNDEDVAGMYPAFKYINSLGIGWYMPTVSELGAICSNKEAIKTTLNVLKDAGKNVDLFYNQKYWSSSIHPVSGGYRYMDFQDFEDGKRGFSEKWYGWGVRAVRAF